MNSVMIIKNMRDHFSTLGFQSVMSSHQILKVQVESIAFFFVDYQKEICSESRVTLYMRLALDREAQNPGWSSFPCGDQTAGGQ